MTETALAAARPSIRVILVGLMIAMMLAMLDNMIVSTALPRIVGEFGGLGHFTWVVTAYVLGTTVSTPSWWASWRSSVTWCRPGSAVATRA